MIRTPTKIIVYEASRWAHQLYDILPPGVAFSADFNARRVLDCAAVRNVMLSQNILCWEFADGSFIQSDGVRNDVLAGYAG